VRDPHQQHENVSMSDEDDSDDEGCRMADADIDEQLANDPAGKHIQTHCTCNTMKITQPPWLVHCHRIIASPPFGSP